jgi:hypothetical protein
MCSVLDEIGAFNQRRGQYAAAEHCLSSVRDFPSAIHSRHCERSPPRRCAHSASACMCARARAWRRKAVQCSAVQCSGDAVGIATLPQPTDAQVLMRAGPVSTIVGLAFNGCAAQPPKALSPEP